MGSGGQTLWVGLISVVKKVGKVGRGEKSGILVVSSDVVINWVLEMEESGILVINSVLVIIELGLCVVVNGEKGKDIVVEGS